MKKFLTLVAALCCAVAAMATDYDGLLTVVVNNDTTQQEAKISLTQSANGYKFSLNNFMLKAGDQVLGVGNIALDSLTAAPQYGYKTIAVKKSATRRSRHGWAPCWALCRSTSQPTLSTMLSTSASVSTWPPLSRT